jgi:propionate CoA-transferase
MSKVCSAHDAVALIRDGQTVAGVGAIGWMTPEDLLKALAERFVATGAPRGLTFYFPSGSEDAMGIRGMDHVAIPGLMKRVVSACISIRSILLPVDDRS